MERRLLLRLLVKLFSLATLLALLYPLFASIGSSPAREGRAQIFDIGEMAPGSLQPLTTTLSVYRRSPRDLEGEEGYRRALGDPDSLQSAQPEAARNRWRSLRRDYFIFHSRTASSLCGVELVREGEYRYGQLAPSAEVGGRSLFYRPCTGAVFDSSGRRFRSATPPVGIGGNLPVPEYQWLDDRRVRIDTAPAANDL